MTELSHILNEYAAFESEVRVFSSELWVQWCSQCKAVCCRAEFCREAVDSPFLFMLHKKYCPQVSYSSEKGWLTATGCALSLGRPPVCYEYLCDTVFDAQQTVMHMYAMSILCKLISHIGKRALGRKHIIEISDLSDLKKVSYSRFKKRLLEARNAFDVVQSFFRDKRLQKDSLKILSKISQSHFGIGTPTRPFCQAKVP